jgi:hypothetical protein
VLIEHKITFMNPRIELFLLKRLVRRAYSAQYKRQHETVGEYLARATMTADSAEGLGGSR